MHWDYRALLLTTIHVFQLFCVKSSSFIVFFLFLQVSATDPDCGVNAMVNYTIGEGHVRIKEFEIKSATGEICLVGTLDYEHRESYEFAVVATDRGKLLSISLVFEIEGVLT